MSIPVNIDADTCYRFYQTEQNQLCCVSSLRYCLLIIESEKASGAFLFNPLDGMERFLKAINSIETFLGEKLVNDRVRITCPDNLFTELKQILAESKIGFKTVVVRLGAKVQAEPGKSRIMVLPDDIIKMVEKEQPQKTRVVIVDDSATIRHMLKTLLKGHDQIEVIGEADRPSVAAVVIRDLKPDVVTLDMNMPEKNGAEFVEDMMKTYPVPFVLVTAIGINEGDLVLRALTAGAVDYIQKPSMADIEHLRPILIEKVRTAAAAKLKPHRQTTQGSKGSFIDVAQEKMPRYRPNLIAIGASTGGTEAIRELLTDLPSDSPPIVITQHIPPMFSTAFANRLNTICKIEVREAEDGDLVKSGLALVAPGDKHMRIVQSPNGLRVVLNQLEKVSGHRPSVDVLFRSVNDSGVQHVWGFLLTGMGKDGAEGLKDLKMAGHWTAAQDEHTSVVYGMPRVAAEIGGTCAVMSLGDIQNLLVNVGNIRKAG